MHQIENFLAESLQKRKDLALYRILKTTENMVDFCSNDYLGFAKTGILVEGIKQELAQLEQSHNQWVGATGSRLLAGNYAYTENLESTIADFHGAEAGLIFNSGYDANVGVLASVPQKGDFLITDEYIHASMIDGARLSYATRLKFSHNDLSDLRKKLEHAKTQNTGRIYVAVESVYSMDGDEAPLKALADICAEYGAGLIVDEAHATGVFGDRGEGLVSYYGLEKRVFARVITFGKALGCHGAIVLGSESLRAFLINFARSFIYTTAAPLHSHAGVKSAYDYLQSANFNNLYLHKLIRYFREQVASSCSYPIIESRSAIQCVVIPGNETCRQVALQLQKAGLDVRAILSPTVPKGKERLRICLHQYNTFEQIDALVKQMSPHL